MDNAMIIGAGPAGLTAAVTCAENGVDVVVIDEYMKAGGRLLGQLYEEPNGSWWNGMKESAALYEKAVKLGVTFHLNVAVHHIEKSNGRWVVYTEKQTFHTNHLLLATGAAESPLPVPGWTLPGVMSVGAAQVMTNVHRIKPGERGVIIGVNVLSAAIAMELQLAGVEIACLTLPKMNGMTKGAGHPGEVMDSLLHVSHMAPSRLVRYGSKFMKNDFMKKLGVQLYPKKGVKMWGIPIQLRKAVIEIYGENKVEGVTIATINADGEVVYGSEEQIEVDFVCIAGGLYPLAELAAVAGCPFYLVEELGGYVPLHNERMESPLEGLYVAGNITGIEGAKVAAAQGKTAGLSIAHRAGKKGLDMEIQDSIKMTEQIRNRAYIQFHPEIEAGRKKISQQWEVYQSTKRSLGGGVT
ncbi:NAD(P)/FAD-dependent oxidoreductase [Bacillus sp. NSP9.1]|uniref:NAD(P)/FAD-dependent oxidoreductase n=1 Tax=Bacillus sp. NSP9.1 TaxID=1071078 RepID=UPI00047D2B70|nr:NAD(P)/FAD-dependent oxidoreductase [Bacillus sp. NSP9.1]QHZ47565.1 FAD-dependent oxidoreductase [Bacillus sp. NSP9.1]